MTGRQHALYRFFDPAGALLYVGISLDPGSRWKQHRDDKPWWAEVAQATIEPHPDRVSVLAAEKAAIIAERPRYNVVHNRGGRAVIPDPAPLPVSGVYDSGMNLWTYHARRSDYEVTTDLHLRYEVNGTAMSDDFLPEEITARELMSMWRKRYAKDDEARILWLVTPAWEFAPFQGDRWGDIEDFLTHFTWPTHHPTGERVNWNRLPVIDLDWSESGDKGGFFQEVTGWKPAPLQSTVRVSEVLRAAGF